MWSIWHVADIGGQHCPCPALVSFSSGFSGKSCPVSICPDSVSLDFVSCLDSVRIFGKNAVRRCLSVRPDKDETELSRFLVSLSTDVWHVAWKCIDGWIIFSISGYIPWIHCNEIILFKYSHFIKGYNSFKIRLKDGIVLSIFTSFTTFYVHIALICLQRHRPVHNAVRNPGHHPRPRLRPTYQYRWYLLFDFTSMFYTYVMISTNFIFLFKGMEW